MSDSMLMWVEIGFNITYLIVVWGLVGVMIARRRQVAVEDWPAARLVIWAFALLALGDTGHVGFRVLAYALGSLEAQVSVLGVQLGLVGLGALSTAITVTIFYMLMLVLWRERFDRQYGWFEYLLFAAGFFRLAFMLLPVNQWNSVVPPQPWSTLRNLPLMLQGLGVAYLFLRDAGAAGDRTFRWMGIMVLVSYACYIPVILFVQQIPVLGMLMIPKTMAYVAIGFLAYHDLYQVRSARAGKTALESPA
ncbi:MAG: hypothetical protein ACWGO1_14740 [Anaerolineales bacterium]